MFFPKRTPYITTGILLASGASFFIMQKYKKEHTIFTPQLTQFNFTADSSFTNFSRFIVNQPITFLQLQFEKLTKEKIDTLITSLQQMKSKRVSLQIQTTWLEDREYLKQRLKEVKGISQVQIQESTNGINEKARVTISP